MDMNGIKFDERYDSECYGTTTLYFTAPKELIEKFKPNEYTDIISTEISVEFPSDKIEPKYGSAMVSPTKEIGTDELSDFDWTDVDLPYEDIEGLIGIAELD